MAQTTPRLLKQQRAEGEELVFDELSAAKWHRDGVQRATESAVLVAARHLLTERVGVGGRWHRGDCSLNGRDCAESDGRRRRHRYGRGQRKWTRMGLRVRGGAHFGFDLVERVEKEFGYLIAALFIVFVDSVESSW